MEHVYEEAIKAGIVGAVLLIILTLAMEIISYWALSQPSLQQWGMQLVNNTSRPSPTIGDVPSSGIIFGIAIILGVLLRGPIYFITGMLSVVFARPIGETRHMIANGIISGAVSQIIFKPISLVLIYFFNSITPGNEQSLASTLRWVAEQLTIWLAVGLIVAIIMAVLGALACGLFIRYTQKQQSPDHP